MKKLLLNTSLAIVTTAFITPSYALNTDHKRELSFGGSALVGALLAGPVGYAVGALGGAYIAEHIKQADASADQVTALSLQYDHLADNYHNAELELEQVNNTVLELQSSLLAQAQTPVFFATGSDQLSPQELAKLGPTIELLKQQQQTRIALDGYADPRGTDGYNHLLSEYRALAVKQALIANGIDETRISSQGHGIKMAAKPNDTSAYALERRVDIQVIEAQQTELVMQ